MDLLVRAKQKVKQYYSVEARGKREKERAEREAHKVAVQADRATLETRQLEMKASISQAKAKAELAKAEELVARGKRKKAEKELKGEGLLSKMVKGLSGSQVAKNNK